MEMKSAYLLTFLICCGMGVGGASQDVSCIFHPEWFVLSEKKFFKSVRYLLYVSIISLHLVLTRSNCLRTFHYKLV